MDSLTSAGRPQTSHVPTVGSTTYRSPTDTVKNEVTALNDGKCWYCGFRNTSVLDIAHNLDASIQPFLVEEWKAMGILSDGFYPAHIGNLVPLCPTCHSMYDQNYPAWVALPVDLNRFIQHERNDYEARAQAAANGFTQRRTLPVVDPNGTPCRAYIFHHIDGIAESINLSQFPRVFKGLPQTMILKALHGCFLPVLATTIHDSYGNATTSGLPARVSNQVHELVQLWNRLDPVPVPVPAPTPAGPSQKRKPDTGDDDGTGTWKQPAKRRSQRIMGLHQLSDSHKSGSGGPKPGKSQSEAVREWLEHIEDVGSPHGAIPVSPPKSASSGERPREEQCRNAPSVPWERWAYGPQKTAADIVSESQYRHDADNFDARD